MSQYWPLCKKAKLVRVSLFGSSFDFNQVGAVVLQAAAHRAAATKYAAFLRESNVVAEIQCYACRPRRSAGDGQVTADNHSEHAHGTAIDIRPGSNPQGSRLVFDFDRAGGTADAVRFINSFKTPKGSPVPWFRWGGDWSTDPSVTAATLGYKGKKVPGHPMVDAMHFELACSPAEIAAHRKYFEEIRDGKRRA